MDPNANLAEQSRLIAGNPYPTRIQRERLRELREALQGWLNGQGFAPDWKAYPEATRAFHAWQRKRAEFQDLYR